MKTAHRNGKTQAPQRTSIPPVKRTKFLPFVNAGRVLSDIRKRPFTGWKSGDFERAQLEVNNAITRIKSKNENSLKSDSNPMITEEERSANFLLKAFKGTVLATEGAYQSYVEFMEARTVMYTAAASIYAGLDASKESQHVDVMQAFREACNGTDIDAKAIDFLNIMSNNTQDGGSVEGREYWSTGEKERLMFEQWYYPRAEMLARSEFIVAGYKSKIKGIEVEKASLLESNRTLGERIKVLEAKNRTLTDDNKTLATRVRGLQMAPSNGKQVRYKAPDGDESSRPSILLRESLFPNESRPKGAGSGPVPGGSGVPRAKDPSDTRSTQEIPAQQMAAVASDIEDGAIPLDDDDLVVPENDAQHLAFEREERSQARWNTVKRPFRYIKRHAVGFILGATALLCAATGGFFYMQQTGDSPGEIAAKTFGRTPITNPSGGGSTAPSTPNERLSGVLSMGSNGKKGRGAAPKGKDKDKSAGGDGPKPKNSGPKLVEIGNNGMVDSNAAMEVYTKLGLNAEDHPQDIWKSVYKGAKSGEIDPSSPDNVGTALMGKYIVLSTAFERFMSGQADPGERSRTQAINMGLELARTCLNLANDPHRNNLSGIERGDILKFSEKVLRYINSPNKVGKGMSDRQKKEAGELGAKINEQEKRSDRVNLLQAVGRKNTPGETDAGEEDF